MIKVANNLPAIFSANNDNNDNNDNDNDENNDNGHKLIYYRIPCIYRCY